MIKCIKPKISRELIKLTNKFEKGKISNKEYPKMMKEIIKFNKRMKKYNKC